MELGGNEWSVWIHVRAYYQVLRFTFIFRDILYMRTLQHVHGLCISHQLWGEAMVTGNLLIPLLRLYSPNTRNLATVLVR